MPEQGLTTPGLTTTGTNLIDTYKPSDGSNYRPTAVIADPNTNANLAGVTAAGALQVDGSAVTQPISGRLTAWNKTLVTASGATVVKNTAGTLAVIRNTCDTQLSVTVSVYDNVSGTSGTPVYTSAVIAPNGGEIYPPPGMTMSNGIVVNLSAALTGNQAILILWS